MTEKQILSRIIQKHDIETNWNKATNFVPMRGELIVYDIDANYDYERLKIGDGTTSVVDLPFTGGVDATARGLIGDLTTLGTEAQTDLVSAVNELVASVVTIDATLTQEGQAADAKATGDAIANLNAQPTCLYADSIEELESSGDTTKKYVLPDGYVYEYRKGTTYTNLLDTIGYQTGYRVNSSGDVVERSDRCVTGLIPAVAGDVIYFKNVTTQTSDYGCNIAHYYSDQTAMSGKSYVIVSDDVNATWNDDGTLKSYAPNEGTLMAYVRFCFVNIDETSIITKNEEIIDYTSDGWYQSEYSFCSNADREQIDKIEERLTSLESEAGEDGVPDYWQAALDEGAEAINTALCNAGRNKSAFLFYSDVHWNYGSQMAPTLLKYLHKHTGMTKTFFGGDIVNDEASDYDTMEYLWEWRKQLKELPNHHSVPGNHDDGNSTNNLFSEDYVYGYLLAAEETPDIVYGDEGLYYYIDSPAEKTRYLCLDTGYKDLSSLSDGQATFITDSLKSTPDGWHIVVVAHVWYLPDYDQYDVRPVPLAGLSDTASSIVAILDNYNSRSGDFADCGGWVEFCIGGHIHYDYDTTTTTGIPIILVETDSQHIRGSLSYTAGTTAEASVNGIIADYDNHLIHVVRIGRGESRDIEVTNVTVSYTNVLLSATDDDGNIYNGVGWQADREISTSSYTERDSSSGYDLTGYLPINEGDIFYLKNIVMPDGVSDRNNTIYMFNSDKSWNGSLSCCTTHSVGSDWNPIFGDDGNLSQFTVPKSSAYNGMYIRINATQIDETSIITINEPIE